MMLDSVLKKISVMLSSLVVFSQFSCSVVSNSLRPHGLWRTRPPCPSPTPEAYSNSCPSSQWCHPAISSSVITFSSCLQSFPASGSFPRSQLFASGGQSIGVSASTSVLPISPVQYSGLISFRIDWFDLLTAQVTLKRIRWLATLIPSATFILLAIQHYMLSCAVIDQS